MKLLYGKKIADKILIDLKKEIKSRRLKLKLAVVLVGNDSASGLYVGKKKEACKKIGIGFGLYKFPEKISPKDLEIEVKKIIENPENSGVIIQLPLPSGLDTKKFLNLIPEQKDADVLSESGFEKFSHGKLKIAPPTVGAVSAILENYKITLKGKYAVIVGAGRLVGKPLAAWMTLKKINFSILDKTTEDLSFFTKKADILISGVGKAGLIKADMVKEGAVVIDVGTAKKNAKTAGDVDFKPVSKKAGFITPVPGGVGPLTVACLLDNLINISTKK